MPSYAKDMEQLDLCFPVSKEQWDAQLSDTQYRKLWLLALNAIACCCASGGSLGGGGGGGCQPAQLTVTVIGGGGVAVSAGAFSQQTGTVVFSDSNGVSFGMDSLGVVTASVSGGGGGANSLTVSAGTTNNVVDALSFANANNASFGLNGSTITVFAPVRFSAGGQSSNLSSVQFGNANGISFGLNAGTITGSHNGLTSQSNQAFSASGGSSTFQTLNFRNANGVTFSNNGGSIEASFSGGGGGSGITLISAGTTDATGPAIEFGDANGISFGVNGNTVTAAHNGLTSQSNQAASASNGSFAFQTLGFSDANGITFGTSAGSIISASHNGLTSQSGQAASASNGSFAFQTLGFSNANGITFGTSAGSIISASHNGLTSQSGQAFSASGGSSAFQTLVFNNANGVTFINNGGSVEASVAAGGSGITIISAGSTDATGPGISFSNGSGVTFGLDGNTITASVGGQSNQTLGLFAVSNTTQGTDGTADARSLSFAGAGIASVGITNGSVLISVPAGGGGITAVNVSAGTTSQNLTNVVFSNSNGISFGLNGSTVTGSVQMAPLTEFWYPDGVSFNAQSVPQATRASIQYMQLPQALTFTNMAIAFIQNLDTQTNNSSAAVNYSVTGVILSRTGETLNSIYSTTFTTGVTWSSNATLSASGSIMLPIPVSGLLTQGNYWVAVQLSTTNTGGILTGAATTVLGNTINMVTMPNTGNQAAHELGVGINSTVGWFLGRGLNSSTGNLTQISMSNISQTGTNMLRAALQLRFQA